MFARPAHFLEGDARLGGFPREDELLNKTVENKLILKGFVQVEQELADRTDKANGCWN